MKNYVITIARQYGSGGKTIGRMLARELGIGYHDKELLVRASDERGISAELIAQVDEKIKKKPLIKPGKPLYTGEVLPPESPDFTSVQNLLNYQAKVIRDLAQKESCVIVGRCADFILRDLDNVLRIYVHAPIDYCIEKTIELHPDFDAEEARRFIQRTDKGRSDYYRCFTGNDWKNADNYDLCINSAVLGWDKCVALVKSYLDIKLS